MKSGIVLIPFVDGQNSKPYQINDKFTANKKRFEELLNAGLISDGKEVVETEEPTDNVDLEDTENQETNELNDGAEDTENSEEEPTDNVDLEDTEEK